MNQYKILDWLVILFLAIGLVTIGDKLIFLSSSDALAFLIKIAQYASLPLGLIIKLFNWVSSEKDKLNKLLEEVRNTALANKSNDELLKEQLRYIRDDFGNSRGELQDSLLDLDRRMIRLEAKQGLSTKLEVHEQRLNELTDRFNRSLIQEDSHD